MNWTSEEEAREQIKSLVAQYYHDFKEKKESFKDGDRISYASRVACICFSSPRPTSAIARGGCGTMYPAISIGNPP